MNKKLKVAFDYFPLDLVFKFDAGTSRGVLKNKTSYIIRASSNSHLKSGYGEAGPLPKLSLDDVPDFENELKNYLEILQRIDLPQDEEGILLFLEDFIGDEYPSIRFALETALLDLINGGKRQIFSSLRPADFPVLPINGLIWMGDKEFMLSQIDKKLEEGFNCIKMKIGAIDFDKECGLLKHIRGKFSSKEISIRLDANGAFSADEALLKLDTLASFDIHSIEQPIKQGNWDAMAKLCADSPIAIALDEELIGVNGKDRRIEMLQKIDPPYIILKPTLIGGIKQTIDWIKIAEGLGIAWWMTSALESNIGLNAIYQLAAKFKTSLPQGLGTGQLYENNLLSPLDIKDGRIFYNEDLSWEDLEKYYK